MRESDIESYLVQRVRELGGECRKVQWIGRKGAPDRLVMLPAGTFKAVDVAPRPAYLDKPLTIWVELKASGEKAKPHQQREHQRMREMGQRVEVIDSMEGVDALLAL